MASNQYNSTANTSWTSPVSGTVMVEVWGGGGSGATYGRTTSAHGAGGGGGGAYSRSNVTVVKDTVYTIVVGAGGSGGQTNNSNGTAGGYSSFNNNEVFAYGGDGGNRSGALGAGGNTNGNGQTKYAGGSGAANSTTSGGGAGAGAGNGNTGNAASGTAGGVGQMGGGTGGNGGAANASGTAGAIPGGGGGGAGSNSGTTVKTGGLGANGSVKLTWTETFTVNVNDTATTDSVNRTIRITNYYINLFDSTSVTEDIPVKITTLKINKFDSTSVTEDRTVNISTAGPTLSVNLYDATTVRDSLGAFPSTVILDNFNRGDGALGSNWSDWSAETLGYFAVSSQAAAISTLGLAGVAANRWNANLFNPDCEVYATIVSLPATGLSCNLLLIRETGYSSTTTFDGYAITAYRVSGTDEITIQKITDGAPSTVAGPFYQELANNGSIGLRKKGATLELWYKPPSGSWTFVGSGIDGTDPYLSDSFYIGMSSNSSSTVFEDFGGGNLSTSGIKLAQLKIEKSEQVTTNSVNQTVTLPTLKIEKSESVSVSDVANVPATLISNIGDVYADVTENSMQQKIIWDGTRYWAFYPKSGTANTMFYAYSTDLSSWTETSVATTNMLQDPSTMDVLYDAATSVVLFTWYDTSIFLRYKRGVISGTTITWSSAYTIGLASVLNGCKWGLDSSNIPFISIDYGSNPQTARATNAISQTFADETWTGLIEDGTIYSVRKINNHAMSSSRRFFVVYAEDNSGITTNPRIHLDYWNGSSWATRSHINGNSDIYDSITCDSAYISDNSLFVLYRSAASTFKIEQTTDQGTNWSTLTAPAWPTDGVATNSQLSLETDGTDLWAFVIRGDASSSISYNKYSVSGNSWGGWTDLVTGGTQTRAYIEANRLNNNFVILWTQTNGSNYEVYTAALSGGGSQVIIPQLKPIVFDSTTITEDKTVNVQSVSAPLAISVNDSTRASDIIVSDSFTDTNGVALATHNPNWSTLSSSNPLSNVEIYNNSIRNAGDWASGSALYSGTFNADQYSQVTLKARTTVNEYVGPIVRASAGTGESGYRLYLDVLTGGNYTRAVLFKNGSWNANNNGTWAINEDHVLKIEVSGTSTTTIKLYVDGVQVGSDITDSSSPITSGSPGFILGAIGDQLTYLDDFEAGPTFGNVSIQSATPRSINVNDSTTVTESRTFDSPNGFLLGSPLARHGATTANWVNNCAWGTKFTVPGTGTKEITEVGAWLMDLGTDHSHKFAIFTNDSSNNCPESMVANSETDTLYPTGSITKVYHTYSGTKPQVTGGSDYWICCMSGSTANNYTSSGSAYPSSIYINTITYPTWPTSAGWETHNDLTGYDLSHYAVYQDVVEPLTISVNDSTSVSEDKTVSLPTLKIEKSESVTVTEDKIVNIPVEGVLTINKYESVTLTESNTVVLGQATPTPNVNDSTTVTDVPTVSLGSAGNLNINVNDTATTNSLNVTVNRNNATTYSINKFEQVSTDSLNRTVAIQEALDREINRFDNVAVAEYRNVIIPTLKIEKSEQITTDSTNRTVSIQSAGGLSISKYETVTTNSLNATLAQSLVINKNDTATTNSLNVTVNRNAAATYSINKFESTTTDSTNVGRRINPYFINKYESTTVSDWWNVLLPVAGQLYISKYEAVSVLEYILPIFRKLFINKYESTNIQESLSDVIKQLHVSKLDATTITEFIALAMSAIKINKFEAVTILENIQTKLAQLKINKYDATTVSEAIVAAIKQVKPNVFDQIGITESRTVQILAAGITSITAYDNVHLVENIVAKIAQLKPSIFDSTNVTESRVVSILSAGSIAASVYDTATLAEQVILVLKQLRKNVFDGVTVTEDKVVQIVAAATRQVSVYDAKTVTEYVRLLIRQLKILPVENVGVTELIVTAIKQLKPSIYETVGVSEFREVKVNLKAIKFDNVSATDAVFATVLSAGARSVALSDTAVISELATVCIKVLYQSLFDVVSVDEYSNVFTASPNLFRKMRLTFLGRYPDVVYTSRFPKVVFTPKHGETDVTDY